jgi:hypothetical protein
VPRASDVIQAARRFAQRVVTYKIFTSDRGSHDTVTSAIIDEIVVATAHENQGLLASCIECQTLIANRWHVSLTLGEILASFRRLAEAGRMTSTPAKVELTQTCATELAARVRSATELETAALAAWESLILDRFPALDSLEVAQLRDELIACIRKLINDRGIEAAIILYPEQRRFKHRLDEVMALSLDDPTGLDPEHALVRRTALKLFFDSMVPIQRHWFLSLLSTTYLMSAFTLDPAAFDAVRRLSTGQRLFLDTNTLYSLLHLQGRRRYEELHEVAERSKLQGYQLCITGWTLKELKRSIESARKKLRAAASHRHVNSDEDERTLATARAILKAHARYCRDTHDTLTPDEFCLRLIRDARYSLSLEGVSVIDDGCEWVDAEQLKIEEQVATLSTFKGHGDDRPASLEEHDVKMRLLVEHLRGGAGRTLANAGYIFLTEDRRLVRYASHPDPDATPFAVTVEAWLCRLRDLQPRVKDYDETLALLLDTPALHVPDILTHEQVMKVILQISAHERSTPELNVQYLLDAPLVSDEDLFSEEVDSWIEGGDREVSLAARLELAEQHIASLEKVRELLESRLEERETTAVTPGPRPNDSGGSLTRAEAARWLLALLCACSIAVFGFSALGGSVPRLVPWATVSIVLALTGAVVGLLKGSWKFLFTSIGVISGVTTIVWAAKTFIH